MNGLRIPDTPIVVDCWNLKEIHPRSLFFLSHMHADHTSGLSDTWLHPIHCTPTSAKLLVHKFKINPKLVVELEVGETKILHLNYSEDHVTITVTTLDANHCPGSAMFLFEGYFGTILYTGDFRFSPTMHLPHTMLDGCRTIDVLYLDNTYCDPQCQFPSREEATDHLVSLINAHPDKIVLFGLYTLGKEDLLVEIAQKLQTWIGVTKERFKRLEILEMPDVFRTDMSECRVRVFAKHMVEKGLLSDMKDNDNYLAILPTCLYTGRGAPPPPNDNPCLKIIPYSDHSSFQELRSFVKGLQPRCVRPIVRKFSGDNGTVTRLRTNMAVFNDLLDKSTSPEYSIPPGVKKLFSFRNSNPKHPKEVVPSVKRTILGSRNGPKPSPKGVHYYSPTKSTMNTNIDTAAQEINTESMEANIEKKKSVCVVRTYTKTADEDESSSSDFILQSSQAAINYCSEKVLEAKKNDWVSGIKTSCARLVPLKELELHRFKNLDNMDANDEVQATHKELVNKLPTDSSVKSRVDRTLIANSRTSILPTKESSVLSVVRGRTDISELPSPKKARVAIVKLDGFLPREQKFTDVTPKEMPTNTRPTDVVISDTRVEQSTVNDVPETMDTDESVFHEHESERQTRELDHVMGKTDRDKVVQVGAVIEKTDPSLYPEILKLVASFMDTETVSQVLDQPSNRPAENFPFKNIRRLAQQYVHKSSLNTNFISKSPCDQEWGPQHYVPKETGICVCKDGRYCLLSCLRMLD